MVCINKSIQNHVTLYKKISYRIPFEKIPQDLTHFFVLFSLTENDIFGALLIHTNQNVFGKFLPEKVWENDRIFPYSILL